MEVRRQRLNTAAQQAAASVSRAANFAALHSTDLDRTILDMLQNAQAQLQTAQQAALQAQGGRLEDAALGRALDQLAATYASAQKSADEAYSRAARDFGQMEALRREAHQASAAQTWLSGKLLPSCRSIPTRSVSAAPRCCSKRSTPCPSGKKGPAKPPWGTSPNERGAPKTRPGWRTRRRHEVRQSVDRIREQQLQDAMGQLIVAGALSALAGSGRRGRRGGGGFGRPWGGGFGGSNGGGGGGSSSGGWGGGGSSSGSFGGGGSSGGRLGWRGQLPAAVGNHTMGPHRSSNPPTNGNGPTANPDVAGANSGALSCLPCSPWQSWRWEPCLSGP